jgi:hypothetical protein
MSSAADQARRSCRYPQSHAIARPVRDELDGVVQNKDRCSSSSAEETPSDLMVKCSPHKAGARHPISGHAPSTSGRTVCRKTSKGLKSEVLTRQPLPEPSLPNPPGRSH